MSHDVFISYARGDRELAAYLARKLDERGVSVWYDAALAAETRSEAETDKAIREAGLFVMLFSQEGNRSDRMRRELALADSLGKPVVPFLLENTQPKGAYLHPLADRNWIQAHPEPMARIEELTGLLARLAGKQAFAPAPPPPPPTESLEEKERRLDAAIGEMIRDVVDPAHAPPMQASAYVGLTDGHGKPVRRLGGGGRMLLTVATLGAYGVVAQRRAIERFRANIRKL
jgi:hypothetical protein